MGAALRCGGTIAAVSMLLWLGTANAGAATITVNTTLDTLSPSSCSLREAISAVNDPGSDSGTCAVAAAGPNTIVLGPGDYLISIQGANETGNLSGDLNVNGTQGPLTIIGAGESSTLIDGSGLGSPCCGTDRDLNVASGVTLTLQNLTVTNGEAPSGAVGGNGANSATGNGGNGDPGSPGENGGGILNAGSLTLDEVAVTDNRAGSGETAARGATRPDRRATAGTEAMAAPLGRVAGSTTAAR